MAGITRRLVLTFHGIGNVDQALGDGERDVWLERTSFVATLEAAKALGEVEITFDDGNASDHEIALPELSRRGIGGTFFVVADRIDRPGYLSTGQMREMVAAGMTIGSHGMHHVPWRGLSDTELRVELVEAREAIERAVDQEVALAACPFGAYDRRVVQAARRAGYAHLYTSDRGWTRAGPFVQARTSLHRDRPTDELRAICDEAAGRRLARQGKRFLKRLR